MASAPPDGGSGGDRQQRWSESKVYIRKSHSKTPKSSAGASNAHPATGDLSSTHRRTSSPPPSLAAANGHRRTVTISLSSRSRHEVRDLRRKLNAELDQVRALARRLEAHQIHLASLDSGRASSQLSISDPTNRRQLSVSVPPTEAAEKEKRTPKANKYYRNPDFVTGKEKFPNSDSHKKSKAHGSKNNTAIPSSAGAVDTDHAAAFKNCSTILTRLMKHKYGWVFNKPVDVKGLGLHDYLTVIKNPMDLGAVKSRLNKNWYKTPGEFAEDVRLTFRNAMTYNAKGQDVYIMAAELLQIFDDRWPAVVAEYTGGKPTKRPLPPPPDVRSLERSDSTVHPVPLEAKVNTHAIKTPPMKKKPKAKDVHKRDMTYDEKQKLSSNLQTLPPEKLDNVVQIIKKRNSTLNQHEDEIEVDIDSVDVETLWELDRFVTNYRKSLSKNKKKAELAVQARADKNTDERVLEPIAAEGPNESNQVVDEMEIASSMPIGEEKVEENVSRSSNSSSSSSGSGSSSSDSGSESSSTNGSDVARSPKS